MTMDAIFAPAEVSASAATSRETHSEKREILTEGKIRSGQCFLYREGGLPSTVLEVRLTESVCGSSLKRALDIAMLRFPYFADGLREERGDYYLAPIAAELCHAETPSFRALGSAEIHGHLIDVTFWGNAIRVSFFHGICDGLGIKPFLETLLYYYFSIRHKRIYRAEGIRLAGQPLLPGETDDPFAAGMFELRGTPLPEIKREGFAIPESTGSEAGSFRTEFDFNADEFIHAAKSIGGTPSILMALLFSRAIRTVHPEADMPVVCNLACDMRKQLGKDHTARNCVGSVFLPYDGNVESLPFNAQAAVYRKMLDEQRADEVVRKNANAMVFLSQKLDSIASLDGKRQMMSFFNGMRVNSFVISYLGKFNFGECSSFIESTRLYSGGNAGLILNMTAAGNTISLDVEEDYESESYLDAFERLTGELGITVRRGKKIRFSTPRDAINECKVRPGC